MVKSLPLPQSLAYHNRGKLIIKMSRGARKDGKANLIFHLPINYPPSCIFSPSHQPPLALLTRSHALRFVLVHYPQEKQVEEAGKLIRLYKVNPAKYGNRISTAGLLSWSSFWMSYLQTKATAGYLAPLPPKMPSWKPWKQGYPRP